MTATTPPLAPDAIRAAAFLAGCIRHPDLGAQLLDPEFLDDALPEFLANDIIKKAAKAIHADPQSPKGQLDLTDDLAEEVAVALDAMAYAARSDRVTVTWLASEAIALGILRPEEITTGQLQAAIDYHARVYGTAHPVVHEKVRGQWLHQDLVDALPAEIRAKVNAADRLAWEFMTACVRYPSAGGGRLLSQDVARGVFLHPHTLASARVLAEHLPEPLERKTPSQAPWTIVDLTCRVGVYATVGIKMGLYETPEAMLTDLWERLIAAVADADAAAEAWMPAEPVA